MTAYYDMQQPKNDSVRLIIPRLVTAVLGVSIVLALYLLVPGLQLFDLGLLLVVVLFLILGYSQDIVGGIRSLITLYIASGVAASVYRGIAPYVGAFWSDLSTPGALTGPESDVLDSLTTNNTVSASTFLILLMLVWAILEVIGRLSFQDVSLPVLAFVDKIGGILIFMALGILVASLLFNVMGYGRKTRRAHDASLLRPTFNTVFRVHYASQSFWFGKNPPPIYTYDLD